MSRDREHSILDFWQKILKSDIDASAGILFNLGCSIWFFCLQRPADLKSHFHNLMSRKTVAAKLDRTNKVCFHRIKESPDEINERVMSGALTDPRRLYSNLNVMPCNLIVFVWCLFTVSWTAARKAILLFFLQTTFLLGTFFLDNCLLAHHTEHYNGNYSV